MKTSDREIVLHKIAEVEQQIAGLQEQQKEAETTLLSLRKQLQQNDFETASREKQSEKDHASTVQNLGNRSMHCPTTLTLMRATERGGTLSP